MDSRIRAAALKAAKKHESFYLYDEKGILESTNRLKNSFPNVNFIYSVKCNPDKNVLKTIFNNGFGADAASIGEVLLSEKAGLKSEDIYYSAPGKTMTDIEQSLKKCVLIADSISEIYKIQTAAGKAGVKVKIGIRINPDFTFFTDKGNASKFGIDEDKAFDFLNSVKLDNVQITGIHVHLRSQELKAELLLNYWKNMLLLANKFCTVIGPLEYINMGSGIGIPYAETDTALDIGNLGYSIKDEVDKFHTANPHTKIIIETGRYAVCDNGWYITKVLDRKESYGKIFIILKNTLNGFIRPSLAKLIMTYTEQENPDGTEPLFTSKNAFSFIPLKEGEYSEKVSLTGNLCTSADIVAEDVMMPHLEEGDLIAVTNAGSYAAVLSPMQFSSQIPPVQLFLAIDNSITD